MLNLNIENKTSESANCDCKNHLLIKEDGKIKTEFCEKDIAHLYLSFNKQFKVMIHNKKKEEIKLKSDIIPLSSGNVLNVVRKNDSLTKYLISSIDDDYILVNTSSGYSNYKGKDIETLIEKYLEKNTGDDILQKVNPIKYIFVTKNISNDDEKFNYKEV